MSCINQTRDLLNRRLGLLIVVMAVILVVPATVSAQNSYHWSVATGDWSTAANWGGTEPVLQDDASIQNGGTATISSSGDICRMLSVGGQIQEQSR